MTFEEFKSDIHKAIINKPNNWRKGQTAFNYIDEHYGVARIVQFNDHIDCFFNDDDVDEFIKASYKRYEERMHMA